MSLQLNKIKSRIKTVKGAYKVTSAMKLVSTARLSKYKNRMLANKEYQRYLDEITKVVLANGKKIDSPFLRQNTEANKNLYIIISSTLGLCGSYNNNIFKVADIKIQKEDDAILLGGKALSYFKNGEFTKIDDFSAYHSINDESIIRLLVNFVEDKFIKGEYKEVHIIYTEYKNSLVFLAKDSLLLPLSIEGEKEDFPPILEPSREVLVETLTPLYAKASIHAKLLESEVCEQAARRNAMENATDNAEEILKDLQIEFNKARQTAITQEITEIVSAANAI